ncbi:MAG: hypothetical protein FH749_02630 [Firmicutes bacterium]|nr:hypothetical protein [Bacillota bacterium]
METNSKSVTDWTRLGYALVAFIAVLMYLELFLPGVAQFNSHLEQTHAQVGYIAAIRGQALLLWVLAALAMVSLFRVGVPIGPVAWIVQLARLGYLHADPWYEVGNSLFFVSPGLNFLLMALVPPALSFVIWWSFGQLARGRLARVLDLCTIPGLWLTIVLLVSVGNLFFWHWSPIFAVNLWPTALGVVLLVAGLPLVTLGSVMRPVTALLVYWAGLLFPVLLGWTFWGVYDGTFIGLLTLLPALGTQSFGMVWLELVLLFAVPLLAVVLLWQVRNWRQGKKFLQIW